MGEFVFKRTYSRIKADGNNESWADCVERVVNGTFNMQKRWILANNRHWDEEKAQKTAQKMYDKIWNMKFLPPGRGLWAMGSPLTEERNLHVALNNCAFVSTEDLCSNPSKPFTFLMEASMLGIGVGFDTKGAANGPIPVSPSGFFDYTIPDSREGWVESVRLLIDSYFKGGKVVRFNYDEIRPKGTPIKGFGGVASGFEPLKRLHEDLTVTLDANVGKPMSVTTIVDIMNHIGRCVVAGNVRQSAEIAFGEATEEYLNLKNYAKNPHRIEYGWTSNNSVFAKIGMDYGPLVERIADNGEPGIAWLQNMREFSRMGESDWKDENAAGGNPCLEQTLESYELCCLVENFPEKHESLEEFLDTLSVSYLYAKTVTLGTTPWPETNDIIDRNRRIGTSISGLAQFNAHRGVSALVDWCREGYDTIQRLDEKYSKWLQIPKSIKTTSVKPSGSVSLLAGSTPGMHWPLSEYYIRRIRISKQSQHLIQPFREAGYVIEDANEDPNGTAIILFPIHIGKGVRSLSDVSMWEQLELASLLQQHWADNQVSCTISFDKKEASHIAHALDYFQYKLKGISFLPKSDYGYVQAPYEPITQEEYETLLARINNVDLGQAVIEAVPTKFCDNSSCEVLSSLE
eukprot:TRINITY_DN4968_c0_g1_i1.p1 TRINITY_DN4968_c0_g1~~TRINITY_DN4968_c0_g1_i1.p1  ORF type:complete len:694 (+),score=94.34 TRINITY_DN4968_c0_g1_i1:195-2084(+)